MSTATKNNTSVQSLSRGLSALRLLAHRGPMTATEIARELGLHQSSASRLLRSLVQEGLVYKPEYHLFAPDVGLLKLAGIAMEQFPEVSAAAGICIRHHEKWRLGTAAAMLVEDRLLYLSWIDPQPQRPMSILDNSECPLHRSSPGLALLYDKYDNAMPDAIATSVKRFGFALREGETPESLAAQVRASFARHGFLLLREFYGARANAAMLCRRGRRPVAFAAFTYSLEMSDSDLQRVLGDMVAEYAAKIGGEAAATREASL